MKSRFLSTIWVCVVVCLLPFSGYAETIVLDFDGRVPPGSIVELEKNYFEDGFWIERNNNPNPFFALWSGNPPPTYPGGVSSNGTDMLVFGDSVEFLSIFANAPDELFTPLSIDLAMVAAATGSSSLRIEGHFQAGNSISDQLTVTNNWQTFTLPPNFVNLTELRIFDCPGCGGIFGMDNLTLTPIPIPPAIWLFGSGLLGLIGLTRRRAL